jgi:lysozyme
VLALSAFFQIVPTGEAAEVRNSKFPVDANHVTSLSQLDDLKNGSLGIAGADARALMPFALELIKDFESWKANAYEDASGYCTIGYGHLIALQGCEQSEALLRKFNQPLDKYKGLEILTYDTVRARLAVQSLVEKPLTDAQFGALVSFVFNVGTDNFRRSTLLKYLNNAEYDGAATQFRRYIKSKGKVLPGLQARRNCEAALFLGQIPSSPRSAFNRMECSSLGAAASEDSLVDIEKGEP